MLNLNEARLLGRLAEDPQFSVTAGGREWMRCRVLTNHPYRDDHGSWQERVEGHIVATFDKYRIEHARQKLRKGCAVYVEGELRNSRREVNGQVEYFYSILVPMGGKLHLILDPAGRGDAGEADCGGRPEPRPEPRSRNDRPSSNREQSAPAGGSAAIPDPFNDEPSPPQSQPRAAERTNRKAGSKERTKPAETPENSGPVREGSTINGRDPFDDYEDQIPFS